jgi:hypothetical protein
VLDPLVPPLGVPDDPPVALPELPPAPPPAEELPEAPLVPPDASVSSSPLHATNSGVLETKQTKPM